MNNQTFKDKIPDKGIRNFIAETILGMNKFSSALNYYEAMDNIITLAFLYSFSCYLELRNSSYNKEGKENKIDKYLKNGNANSKRVIRIFEKIYTDHPITDELVQFVLLDIQFDLLSGSESKLRTFFPWCADTNEFNLTEYFSMINQYHVSSREQDYSIDELSKKLEDLIDFFPFLTKTQLVYDEKSGWYVFRIKPGTNFPDGIIHTFGVIHRFKYSRAGDRFYYLSSIKKDMYLRYENCKDSIRCVLNDNNVGINSPEIIESPYEINADIETIATYLNPNIQTFDVAGRGYATQLYSINYKYIKHLALAISDSLGHSVHKESVEKLKSVFYKTANKDYSSDLDVLVLMLLIENSPIRVLNVLIKFNQPIAFEILKNLKNRLGVNFNANNFNLPFEDEVVFDDFILEEIKSQLGENYGDMSTELLNECKAELKTDLILRMVSAVNNNTSFHFSTRLKQGFESLTTLKDDANPSNEILYRTIHHHLCSIIKRLTCFYAGVFGFGEHKIAYDAASKYSLPSDEKIKEFQEKCLSGFVNEAKKKWQEIKDEINVKKIIENFINLCSKCNDGVSSNRQGRSNESFRLHSVLGKYTVMNVDKFKKEIEFDNISDLTNDLSRESLKWWLDKAIRVVRFFATGSFDNDAGNDPSRAFIKTINPILASFYRNNKSRDGFDSAVFFLTMDANYDHNVDYQKEINVLSEFKYDMNTKYYCLPNVSRADDKWWIDPLLIDCDKFDSIFKE